MDMQSPGYVGVTTRTLRMRMAEAGAREPVNVPEATTAWRQVRASGGTPPKGRRQRVERFRCRRRLRYTLFMDQILIALAGVMGAAGIMLTAAGAHSKPGVGLDSAGYLLLIHALAVIAGLIAARQGLLLRPLGLVAGWGFVAGAGLFAGDVAMRVYLGTRLFPMAAPAGGMIMILAWVVLIPAALMAWRAG